MNTYISQATENPIQDLSCITSHLEQWGINPTSITLSNGRFILNLEDPVPEDQLDHLGLVEL